MRVLDGSKSSIISIHALLAESDRFHAADISTRRISIHALLAESDLVVTAFPRAVRIISIHALLAESDRQNWHKLHGQKTFLSTLSLRRATKYPAILGSAAVISIHALLAESDLCCTPKTVTPMGFLSTLSLRRATQTAYFFLAGGGISIHALLAESDAETAKTSNADTNFYPRSPCGERHNGTNANLGGHRDFYPRSPCGERRYVRSNRANFSSISIHALLAESDLCCTPKTVTPIGFLSTLSLRRATIDTSKDVIKTSNFYPRSPCGERRIGKQIENTLCYFYPRSPCGERQADSVSKWTAT